MMREVDLGVVLAKELEYGLLAVLVAKLAAQTVRQGLVNLRQGDGCIPFSNVPNIRVLDYLVSVRPIFTGF